MQIKPEQKATLKATLLKKQDVADMLGVSVYSIQRYVSRGQLRCVNLGHSTKRFRPCDVELFMARRAGEVLE